MSKITKFQGPTRWLSNFEYVFVRMSDGITYPSTEHAFQAQKTLDMGERSRIASLQTPRQAKDAGQLVELRADWETVKFDVMLEATRRKFERSRRHRQLLIETGDAELIEGNTWGDTIWGVCDGVGENHLGRILMKVRAEILAETEE